MNIPMKAKHITICEHCKERPALPFLRIGMWVWEDCNGFATDADIFYIKRASMQTKKRMSSKCTHCNGTGKIK